MNKKILVADDEVYVRELVDRSLEPLKDLSVELFFASGGEEALRIVTENGPDLVILDIMMPDLDGIEVCRRVKRFVAPPYVMMLTAKGQKKDRIDALEVYADEFITKPFDPEHLLDRVAQVLRVSI
jgi:two-component system, OmpR family, alkaline phosphatase synthesis response regulator PhoP